MSSLHKLRRNEVHRRAVETIDALFGRLSIDEDPLFGLKVTNWGESRIDNCVKYDLQGRARLVTVQKNNWVVLVYVGDHDDCDKWLDKNRGLTFSFHQEEGFRTTFVTSNATTSVIEADFPASGLGDLFARLPDDIYDELTAGIPNSRRRTIEKLDAAVSDSELKAAIGVIVDEEQRKALFDVFVLLRQHRIEAAIERAALYLKRTQPLVDVSAVELEAAPDNDHVRKVPADSMSFAEMVKTLTAASSYKDWMTFLHPEQEKVVLEDHDGPAKLLGVSGSGKTCVVVRRAVRLAETYEDDEVLILTLNPALAALIDTLVTDCTPVHVRPRIKTRTMFDVCKSLLLQFEPSQRNTLDPVTWRGREHIDEIWQEYYRCELNNYDARVFQPVHDSLLIRGWNPERYLREEVDWLRSALWPFDRDEYLDTQKTKRKGRALPLAESFRRAVLAGAEGWDQKMRDIGAIDLLGLVERLSKHMGRIRPQYRCVILDEGQDFGTTELSIVRRLVAKGPNDLFIAGDAAQAVSTKHQSLTAADIDVPRERARRLSLNYRNSVDVLQAAYAILKNNLSEEMLDREDFQILDPELSSFRGNVPLILAGDDVEDELAWAIQHLKNESGREGEEWRGCIAVCGFSLHELQQYGRTVNLPVLDGTVQLNDGPIFLSDLEQTKGFEFNAMCIVNCSDGTLPDSAAPVDEQHRDLARFYVAMTRARTDLILSWSGTAPSPFLKNAEEHFYPSAWNDLVVGDKPKSVPKLKRLESLREEGIHLKDIGKMTGEEFLFTPHALGLSAELIARIRELIDGRGLRRGNTSIKWSRMRQAMNQAHRDPRTRAIWGPEVHSQLLRLGERVGLIE